MTPAQTLRHLQPTNALARQAVAAGHQPFAALRVAEDSETMLLAQAQVDTLNHAETALLQITGNHPDNPTLSLPCREVFARGHKALPVVGPVPEAADDIAQLHRNLTVASAQLLATLKARR